ncbi:MAG: hypothetical protein HWN79_19215, partial [Candidatus Lokiarchaeota archaeon]|nr:hypothetical protein [Candidatus Lokiarchaeota archaeon]
LVLFKQKKLPGVKDGKNIFKNTNGLREYTRSELIEEIKKIKDMNLTKLESSDFYSPILPFIKNIAIGSKGIKGSNVKKLLEKRANVNKTQLYWSGLLNEIDSDTIYDKDTLVNLARQNIPKIEIITNTGSTNARYKDLQRIPLVEDNSKDKFATVTVLAVSSVIETGVTSVVITTTVILSPVYLK